MKKYKYIAILSVLGLIISCKEKIELPLTNQASQLVIESEIDNGTGPYYVKLSMSKEYNSNNEFIPVNPTLAIISDNTGVSDTLTKIKDGWYQTNKIAGTIGNTYYLKVNYNNKEYTAQSKMAPVASIDSIYAFSFIIKPESRYMSITIKEPANETNYYRYFLKVNNRAPQRQYAFEDKLINGTRWNFSANQEDVKIGDSVEFFLLGIDKNNFEYFKVIAQNATLENNGNTAAAPVNPISNISNNALGYFSAHAKTSKKFLVK